MFSGTSTVNAQTIKKITPNKFEIDSTGVKEVAKLIIVNANNTKVISLQKDVIVQQDTTIKKQDSSIAIYKSNETLYNANSMLQTKNYSDLEEKTAKQISHMQWKVNKTYIGAGLVVALTIFTVLVTR